MDECLYRFFDKNDNLLYVGISSNWKQRLSQHYKESDFHYEATKITLEHFNTREEVEEAEKLAILVEKPKYNKAHNPNYESPTNHIQKIRYWVYSNLESDSKHKALVEELRRLFIADPLWTSKSTGPIAYYLLEYLPEWDKSLDMDCDVCVSIYHSEQIAGWAEPMRKKQNAAD
jgi:predicted GIY-YIG superfamily endonuclease